MTSWVPILEIHSKLISGSDASRPSSPRGRAGRGVACTAMRRRCRARRRGRRSSAPWSRASNVGTRGPAGRRSPVVFRASRIQVHPRSGSGGGHATGAGPRRLRGSLQPSTACASAVVVRLPAAEMGPKPRTPLPSTARARVPIKVEAISKATCEQRASSREPMLPVYDRSDSDRMTKSWRCDANEPRSGTDCCRRSVGPLR